MPAPVTSIVFPPSLQWLGIAREAVAGTVVAPALTTPAEKIAPDDKFTRLDDKSLRGSMGDEFAMIDGVQVGELDWSGPVYMDAFGHSLFNIFGDYTATGSTPTNSTTLSAQVSPGNTTATVVSGTGYVVGQAVQLGVTGDGNPEVVVLSAVSGTTLTFASTPARFTHASGKAVATVVAPFTHNFSLFNGSSPGLGGGQPPTHTLTHYQGITATSGARQYGYWCASGIDLTVNAEQLFMHDTKGVCFLSTPFPTVVPTNTLSTAAAQPAWETIIQIAGSQVNDIQDCAVSIARAVKPLFTADGAQSPFMIARNTLGVSGKFTRLAQSESPLLNAINNTQQQLQVKVSNGLSGANLLSCTFNMQLAGYDTAKLNNSADELMYDVSWKAILNTTNAGFSGGQSPAAVVLQNAVPTY